MSDPLLRLPFFFALVIDFLFLLLPIPLFFTNFQSQHFRGLSLPSDRSATIGHFTRALPFSRV